MRARPWTARPVPSGPGRMKAGNDSGDRPRLQTTHQFHPGEHYVGRAAAAEVSFPEARRRRFMRLRGEAHLIREC